KRKRLEVQKRHGLRMEGIGKGERRQRRETAAGWHGQAGSSEQQAGEGRQTVINALSRLNGGRAGGRHGLAKGIGRAGRRDRRTHQAEQQSG
ncbi:hypothetical protein T310_9121, partial [Rasamsonia emersonii CBS 393.64]